MTVVFCIVAPTTERLDRFLADQLAISRTQAARLIADKLVTSAGRPLRASALLERGAEVTVELAPEAPPRTYAPAHAELRFVYEDEHLAVLDKPAGLVVHPGPGHWGDSLVNVLVGRGTPLSEGGGSNEGRPGIVHRLDRDTSGLLIVAKTDAAHRRLATAIERREVTRVYAALVWGHLRKSPVEIEAPIARNPKDRKKMTVADGGRHALTHAAVVARFGIADLGRGRPRLRVGRQPPRRAVGTPRGGAARGARAAAAAARRCARLRASSERRAAHARLRMARRSAPRARRCGGRCELACRAQPLAVSWLLRIR